MFAVLLTVFQFDSIRSVIQLARPLVSLGLFFMIGLGKTQTAYQYRNRDFHAMQK